MEIEEFLNYINKMYDGKELSFDELRNIDIKAAELVDKMRHFSLTNEEGDALWCYIDYYDSSKYLNEERNRIIMSYYEICEEINAQKVMNEKNNHKVLSIKKINSDGLINTISIISIVSIIGILIAFITIIYLKIKI